MTKAAGFPSYPQVWPFTASSDRRMRAAKTLNMIFPERRLRRELMIEYEMRILAADGRLRWAIALFCPDDEGAKEYARQVVDRYDIELWRGDRKIERFNHTP